MIKTRLIECVKTKLITVSILALAIFSASSQTNILYGNVRTFGLSPDTNVQMVLQIISPVNRTWNGHLISNDAVPTPEGTNGSFSFTNVLWGYYKLFANDSSGTAWTVTVPSSASNSIPIASLVGRAVLPPDPSTNYYTQAQMDAIISTLVIGSGSGTATNISNSTGTNVNLSGTFTGTVNYPGTTIPAISSLNLYTPDGFDLTQYSIDDEIGTVGATLFDPLGAADTAQSNAQSYATVYVGSFAATGTVAQAGSAVTVTGQQSNTIATALQSVPTTYALKSDATNIAAAATNGLGNLSRSNRLAYASLDGEPSIPTTNSVVQTNDSRALNLTNANNQVGGTFNATTNSSIPASAINVTLLMNTTNILGGTNLTSYTLTNSALTFTVTPGIWFIMFQVEADTASTTSGINFNLFLMGGDTWRGYFLKGVNFSTATYESSPPYIIGGNVDAAGTQAFCSGYGYLTTTQTNTYNLQLYERNNVDAAHTPYIATTSYIYLRKDR